MDADATVRRRTLTFAPHLSALIAYAAITVAITWPLAVSLGSAVPADAGDPVLSAVILWWNAHRLPFTEAWWNAPFFFPAPDSLALSDHRVGLGLLSTPLLRLGGSPVAVYGITYLLTWWLSAIAMYALVWALTGNRGAAFLAGCVFGFNPFRAAHLAHLELLAAYCLPIVLLALHKWLETRRDSWLMVLTAAWLLQALTGGYFFVFMTVFIALWLAWFARDLTPGEYGRLVLALAIALVVVAPVFLHYRQVHQDMALARSIHEIHQYSADVISLLTAAEPLALWNSPRSWMRPETELMPGVVAVGLVVMGLVASRRRTIAVESTRAIAWLRRASLVIALATVAIAMLPRVIGPVSFTIASIPISISGYDKPFSIAFVCAMIWLLTSQPVMAWCGTRSVMAFYGLAAVAMWLFALGPEGRFMGRAVLYKAPYAWLMWLPGFADEFRAPARFAMLAVLGLSVAAGVALAQLTSGWPVRSRRAAVAIISLAVLAESWIYPFPIVAAPVPLDIPASVPASAVVLELPAGIYEDAAAMLHAVNHRRPILNGVSGYSPPHYTIFLHALAEGNVAALSVLRRRADIAVFVRRDSGATGLTSALRAMPESATLGSTATHDVLVLKMQPELPPPPTGLDAIAIAGATAHPTTEGLPWILDDDWETAWTSEPQRGDEYIVVKLREETSVSCVGLSLGRHVAEFPRRLEIDVSIDGEQWSQVWAGDGAVVAVEAALRDSRNVEMLAPFAPQRAGYVRIRQTGLSTDGWAVTRLRILAAR